MNTVPFIKVLLAYNTACIVSGHSTFIRTPCVVSLLMYVCILYHVGCCYSAAVMAGVTLCVAIAINTYLMGLRIFLQSVANLPLLVFFHFFILLLGVQVCTMYMRVFVMFTCMVPYTV